MIAPHNPHLRDEETFREVTLLLCARKLELYGLKLETQIRELTESRMCTSVRLVFDLLNLQISRPVNKDTIESSLPVLRRAEVISSDGFESERSCWDPKDAMIPSNLPAPKKSRSGGGDITRQLSRSSTVLDFSLYGLAFRCRESSEESRTTDFGYQNGYVWWITSCWAAVAAGVEGGIFGQEFGAWYC